MMRVRRLNKVDSWYGAGEEQCEVKVWPKTVNSLSAYTPFDREYFLPPADGTTLDDRYVPFTTWRIGPLPEGELLVSLIMRFSGETYDRLLGDGASFTIDGPDRLIDAIDADIARLEPADALFWREKLFPFRDFLAPEENYDIIILGPPAADDLIIQNTSSIICAPNQPPVSRNAKRFISMDNNFSLVVEHAKHSQAVHGGDATPEATIRR